MGDYTLHKFPQPEGEMPPSPMLRSKSLPAQNFASRRVEKTDAGFSPTAGKIEGVKPALVRSTTQIDGLKTHTIKAATKSDIPKTLFGEKLSFAKPVRAQAVARETDREWEFTQLAKGHGTDHRTAKALYDLTKNLNKDPVTGFGLAEDLEAALSRAAKTGTPLTHITVDLLKLSKLNEATWESGANETIHDIAKLVKDFLEETKIKIAPFRDGGTLSFLVEGQKDDAIDKLTHALANATQQVKLAYKIDLATAITKPTHTINLEDAIEPPKTQRFLPDVPWSSTQMRRERFAALATSTNKEVDGEKLYEVFGGGKKDTLTGLNKAIDRIPTLQNAINEVKTNGKAGVYVACDIRNLKGLNRELGRSQADFTYAKIIALVKEKLIDFGKEAGVDLAGFRHGGDECSFIALSQNAMPAETLQKALQAALSSAQAEIKKEFKPLQFIKHAKYPDDSSKAGTGITFASCPITATSSTELIISKAGRDLERQKKTPQQFMASA